MEMAKCKIFGYTVLKYLLATSQRHCVTLTMSFVLLNVIANN